METTKKEIIEKIDIVEKFLDEFKGFVPKIILSIIILFIGYILAREIKKIFKKVMKKNDADITVVSFFSQVIFSAIIIGFVIAALGTLGVPSSSFITIIGAIGVAIGLALQNNLSNFASGIIILMFQPFKSGDFIEIQGSVSGTVYNITAMNTSLDTSDNKRIYVPNSMLTSSYVVNYSENNIRIMVINTKITYDSDHNKAMEIVRDILENNQYIINKESILCEISDLNIHYVNIISKSSVHTDDYFTAYYAILKSIKDEFDEKGIKFANSKNIATSINS